MDTTLNPDINFRHTRKAQLWFTGLFLSLLTIGVASSAEVTLPLRLPISLLQTSLRDALNIHDITPAEIFRQGDCRFIQLTGLQLESADGKLLVKTQANLKFGPEWFGSCYGAIAWKGQARFELEPYITPDHLLRYRLLDTELIDDQGNKSLAAEIVWKLVARIMRPRLEAFQIDLRPPRTEVANVLHNFVPESQVQQIDAILGSARATILKVGQDELSIPLILDVPDQYLSQTEPTPSEAPLSSEELANFEQTSQSWDAFLVYIIRNLGLSIENTDLRIRLLEILLNSRYQVIAILSGEAEQTSGDPTRELFVRAWNDLRDLITEASQRGQLTGQLLPYLSFLTAGDALMLLDTSAPGLSIEMSENGLRRLARAMRPLDPSDPLKFDWNLDPFLQDLFDLNDDQQPAPPAPTQTVPPGALHEYWLNFFIPAAQAEEATDIMQHLSERLDPWVPKEDELDVYRIMVAALLATVHAHEITQVKLTSEESADFSHLLSTTALIESCWRQYNLQDGAVSYVRSPSGSIGMMQINPSVWRGIFEIERLKKDTGYNATVGARILLRYLRLHARPIARKSGNQDDLARATYAAYNAGPRAAGRFLNPQAKARIKQVDDKFWKLYQTLRDGGTVDLQSCSVTPPTS